MEQQILIKTILGIMLIICGMKDLKSRKISLYIVGIAFLCMICLLPFYKNISYLDLVGGFLIGILLITISMLSRGQIGIGDGLIFCVTGLGLGFWNNVCLLLYSLLLAAIFAGIILTLKYKNRKQVIPFIPFVCVGYIGVLFI